MTTCTYEVTCHSKSYQVQFQSDEYFFSVLLSSAQFGVKKNIFNPFFIRCFCKSQRGQSLTSSNQHCLENGLGNSDNRSFVQRFVAAVGFSLEMLFWNFGNKVLPSKSLLIFCTRGTRKWARIVIKHLDFVLPRIPYTQN